MQELLDLYIQAHVDCVPGSAKVDVLLSAFGNAKTPRNDDSSRFAKLIRIFFAPPAPGVKPTITMMQIRPLPSEETFRSEKEWQEPD